MSKRQWLMVFGILVAVLPFLGFPDAWNRNMYLLFGLLIMFIAFSLGSKKPPAQTSLHMPFSEHRTDIKTDTEKTQPAISIKNDIKMTE